MKYSLDCEFIDTPTCSALISIGLVREDGERRYWEVEYPKAELTPWLNANVLPHLMGLAVPMELVRKEITEFIGVDIPEIWCYFGAYDWYWFCRVFGGFMNMNPKWPPRFFELADYRSQHFPKGIPPTHGPEHHALSDALSQMDIMRYVGIVKS